MGSTWVFSSAVRGTLLGLGVLACGAGCSTGIKTLMPTPLVFTELGVDPVAHVPEGERFPARRVYFATNRERADDHRTVAFTNTPSEVVSVGLSMIGFGSPTLSWDQLREASVQRDREGAVQLTVNGVVEAGGFRAGMTPDEASGPEAAGWWVADLADTIGDARDKDLLIYVHGAKVDFYNGNAFAAQLDHFMGRDMTSLAFCWPTHQDIISYGIGTDLRRTEAASDALATLIAIVSEKTPARRIHILAWSAGARVLTGALASLRDRYTGEDDDAVRQRFRIRTAYFAAGDIPRDRFIEALPAVTGICERVIVTATSGDSALRMASRFMGGGIRLGQKGDPLTEEQFDELKRYDGLEVLDVSLGSSDRGFDITGHDYWFTNPWASTDVLLAIRSDLAPAERGLEPASRSIGWYLPEDYPRRLRDLPPRALLRGEN